MFRVGLCEDQDAIRKVLVRGLRQAGHEVVSAHNGAEAVRLFVPEQDLDVIIMDIGLPDADGRDVVQALKSGDHRVPVLFLTALGTTEDKLQGFAAGGDDYVVKPFEIREVLARINVLATRGRSTGTVRREFELDPVSHSARTPSAEVRLTPTEFRMLAAIASRPGEVVRRRAVVAAAWPDGSYVSENTIDSFIRRVRTKLESIDAPVHIETVRGVGFRVR